ncbi:MAG: GNAT family N-acetyltransferase [Nitrososphaerota archaeon]
MPDDIMIKEIPKEERDKLELILDRSFEGMYLWHSKRTLRDVDKVFAAMMDDEFAGLVMLKPLDYAIGYIYYIAVHPKFRQKGVASRLLDFSLDNFSKIKYKEVYATVEKVNYASLALFRSRGFTERSLGDLSSQYGRIRALSMLAKMRFVPGEIILYKSL